MACCVINKSLLSLQTDLGGMNPSFSVYQVSLSSKGTLGFTLPGSTLSISIIFPILLILKKTYTFVFLFLNPQLYIYIYIYANLQLHLLEVAILGKLSQSVQLQIRYIQLKPYTQVPTQGRVGLDNFQLSLNYCLFLLHDVQVCGIISIHNFNHRSFMYKYRYRYKLIWINQLYKFHILWLSLETSF